MSKKITEKMYKTAIVASPSTYGELEYNELKLLSLISEVEKDIIILRLQKTGHMMRKEEELTTKSKQTQETQECSGVTKLFNKLKEYIYKR